MADDSRKKSLRDPIDQVSKQETPKKEIVQQDNLSKGGLSDNFKEALSYISPRLGGLLIGGTEGLEQTDKLLTGFEQAQLRKAEAAKKGSITPFQQESLRLREEELRLAEESQELREEREERLTDKQKFSKELKHRLSDKEVKDISIMDDGNRILTEIDSLFRKGTVQENLGPFASKIEAASEFIPGVDREEDFVRMQQLVGINLADYVKSISGAQVSEQEAQRLLKNIPNITDKPKAFKVKLKQFKKEFQEARRKYLSNIGIQKEAAQKFLHRKDIEPSQETNLTESELKELAELEELERQGKL